MKDMKIEVMCSDQTKWKVILLEDAISNLLTKNRTRKRIIDTLNKGEHIQTAFATYRRKGGKHVYDTQRHFAKL